MNQIATTIEQSKKLIELGLSADTADMYYYKENVFNNALATFNGALLVKGNSKLEDEYTIPAWSLSALLNVLDFPTLEKDKIGDGKIGWMVSVYPDNCRYDSIWYDNPIDAAFEMVCYLLEK